MASNSSRNSKSSKHNPEVKSEQQSFAERTRLKKTPRSIDTPEQQAVAQNTRATRFEQDYQKENISKQTQTKRSRRVNSGDFVQENAYRELENKERRQESARKSKELKSSRALRAQERTKEQEGKKPLSSVRQEQRVQKQRSRLIKQVSILVLGISAIILLSIWLFSFARSSFFYPSDVQVSGVTSLETTKVADLAVIKSNASILFMSEDNTVKNISAHPWVKEVRVAKKLPDSVIIEVTEREPLARVVFSEGETWLISKDGYWLGQVSPDAKTVEIKRSKGKEETIVFDSSQLIEIVDIPEYERKRAGDPSENPEVNNALKIIVGVSKEFRAGIKSISAVSAPKTKIITQQGIEIAFGTATDIVEKDRIASSIMEEEEGRVVLINVRSIDKPTWRGLNKK